MLNNSVILLLSLLRQHKVSKQKHPRTVTCEHRQGCCLGCRAERVAARQCWVLKEDLTVVLRIWASGPALPLSGATLGEALQTSGT